MTGAEEDPLTPLLDGRYRLGACVGEGGMARVYRGEDVVLGRTVAIKMIRPGVDGAVSERARSEMTVLASLNHPSLVTLYDAHLVPGQPEYLVMEFVEGPTLGSRLDSGPLSPGIVAHLAAELAEALHVVHAAGIVHRDIKPSNVLLSPAALPGARPRAKLADFGIALLLDGSRLTSPGLVIGTVAYLAPEQLRGGEPAPPADIYSLGLVLLEALTGERDHPRGGGMAAALARVESPPIIPVSLGPGWTSLLTRMLNLEPSRRPTAAEVAVAAGELTDGLTSAATAAGSVDAEATAATAPATAATLVAPTAGASVGVGAGAAAMEPARAAAASGKNPDSRRRAGRLLAGVGAGVAAAVVATATIIGVTTAGTPGQQPAPAATTPAGPGPTDVPAPTEGGNEVVVDPGLTEQQLEEQEKARKKAEEEARKQEEEARKREEENRKRTEEEQKRLEEEQKKHEEDAEDDQDGDD
ncbi:serine/threonine-protein kinase [Microbacterium yannicii]|uniref:serine/threonine-protein kinase n=1 Tax=Microbacterium yannicii TaxID=671622 RepID=UPI000365D633|nr:serine/threonine-protein kinase [Microbacterium yannicii]